ncbi:DUF4271 domain-containing protein [Marinoscillum furvescens]|uniref:DUF4271 domain-containing protein n=1 Tax=Marinoscillum furvescens TaxID=1026 RepID=UPI000E263B1D|nr:DUF4271 domain-containing protein [Marinoscillum furvescens]
MFGQTDTLVFQDLSHGWYTIQPNGEPSSKGVLSAEVLAFEVPDVSRQLFLSSKFPVDIWINDQLFYSAFSGNMYWATDLLFEGPTNSRLIVLYGSPGFAHHVKSHLLDVLQTSGPLLKTASRDDVLKEVFTLKITIILILMGLFRRFFPVAFSQSFQNPLASKVRSLSDESSYDSFFNLDNLYAIGFLSVLLATVTIYINRAPVLFWGDHGFWVHTFDWLMFSGLIAIAIIIKFGLYQLLALIFNFSHIPNIQGQDMIRFFILIGSIALGLSLVDFTLFAQTSEFMKISVVILLVLALGVFVLGLFFKLDKILSHRKLMIIAYLCTTEFLPGYLLITWLVR